MAFFQVLIWHRIDRTASTRLAGYRLGKPGHGWISGRSNRRSPSKARKPFLLFPT
jgi:hypothetical protein